MVRKGSQGVRRAVKTLDTPQSLMTSLLNAHTPFDFDAVVSKSGELRPCERQDYAKPAHGIARTVWNV